MEKGQSIGMPLAPENIPSQGVINVFAGEPTYGDSNRVQKSHARMMVSLAIGERRATQEASLLSFRLEDMTRVIFLVIRATIANCKVARVLVDSESLVSVLFQEAFNCMQLEEEQVEAMEMTLFGFAGHAVYPVVQITLPLTLEGGGGRRVG